VAFGLCFCSGASGWFIVCLVSPKKTKNSREKSWKQLTGLINFFIKYPFFFGSITQTVSLECWKLFFVFFLVANKIPPVGGWGASLNSPCGGFGGLPWTPPVGGLGGFLFYLPLTNYFNSVIVNLSSIFKKKGFYSLPLSFFCFKKSSKIFFYWIFYFIVKF
jgi:hypothetical protein